jgi:ankyrin repeat protein
MYTDKLETLQLLLTQLHADLYTTDNAQLQPIHLAAHSNSLKCLSYLLNSHNKTTKTAGEDTETSSSPTISLMSTPSHMGSHIGHIISFEGHLEALKILSQFPTEFQQILHQRDHLGLEMIHAAARGGNVQLVKYLVGECGVDVKAPSGFFGFGNEETSGGDVKNRGWDALMWSCFEGQLGVVKCLVEEFGLEVDSKHLEISKMVMTEQESDMSEEERDVRKWVVEFLEVELGLRERKVEKVEEEGLKVE